MAASRPTMREVAALAGVTPTLVSYVLNGRRDRVNRASPAVERRVREAAKELGYVPDLNARSLRRRRTDRICLLTPRPGVPWTDLLLTRLQEEAAGQGCSVLTLTVDSGPGAGRALDLLRQRLADGAVIAGGPATHFIGAEDMAALVRSGTALIVFSELLPAEGFDVVRAREREACEEALTELIRRGRKRIAYFAHDHDLESRTAPRLGAYRTVLAAAGIETDPGLIVAGAAEDRVAAYHACRRLIESGARPDAIFSASDRGAVSAIWALRDAGLRVPDDVAVVGFGNIPEGTIVRPALTTVGQDPARLAEVGRLLFDRIGGDTSPPKELLFPSEVVWRDSA